MLPEEKSVITKSWETLLELELVSPKSGSGRGGGVQDQYSLHLGQGALVQQWAASSHHSACHYYILPYTEQDFILLVLGHIVPVTAGGHVGVWDNTHGYTCTDTLGNPANHGYGNR